MGRTWTILKCKDSLNSNAGYEWRDEKWVLRCLSFPSRFHVDKDLRRSQRKDLHIILDYGGSSNSNIGEVEETNATLMGFLFNPFADKDLSVHVREVCWKIGL